MSSVSNLPVRLAVDSQLIDLHARQAPHAIEAAAVAKNLQVDPASGLSAAEVAQRRTRYGANALQTIQLGHVFNCRSRTHSALAGLFSNRFVWGAAVIVVVLQLLAVWWSPLTRVLQTVSPNAMDWAIVGLTVLAPIAIVEITKFIARRKHRR